jgi:transposase
MWLSCACFAPVVLGDPEALQHHLRPQPTRCQRHRSGAVLDWLYQRPDQWRQAVQFVAIDMCPAFAKAARQALPNATLVVDHFHIVQLANRALTEVRRRLTMTHRGRRGRKGNREWELRNRLTRCAARMHADHLDSMVDQLQALGKLGTDLLTAWNAEEDLLDLLALGRTRPEREHVARRLYRFYRRCAEAGLPELERLAPRSRLGGHTRCATTRRARGCLNPA